MNFSLLPSGYERIQYISPQIYILTNITAVGSKWEITAQMASLPSANEILLAANYSGAGNYCGYISSLRKWGAGATVYFNFTPTDKHTFEITFASNGITMKSEGSTITRSGTINANNIVSLFGVDETNRFIIAHARIYEVKCLLGGNFNGIPAKRTSDNHQGIYDLANNTFYDLT